MKSSFKSKDIVSTSKPLQLLHIYLFGPDNAVVICLSKNPILHSRAKHFEIKHHFIRDYVQKGILDIQFIDIEHQWDDIFSKPLTVDIFDFLKKNLKMHFVSH